MAYTIPAARTYDWASYCGIPDGIPTRETIYTTLNSSSGATAIQNAVAACPSDQVVYLSAGTYSHGLSMTTAQYCTLRGAGPGQTILNGNVTLTGGSITANTSYWSPNVTIASGYAKDSMSITLSSSPPAAFAVGNLIGITQDDDYDLVWCREGNWVGTRNLRFISRITSVSGNTIGLATPIPYSYSAAQTPRCTAVATNVRMFGLERMTINGAVTFEGSDRCWCDRLEVYNYASDGITYQYGGSQGEVRRCYVHDPVGFPQSDGYPIRMFHGLSCMKIEDNIAYRTAQFIYNSAAGCYTGYNYALDQRRTSHEWVEVSFDSNHGPHSIMDLWEGNVGQRYQNDGYHGSGSHQTVFRNHFHGLGYTGYTQERQLIDLSRGSYYENVVGNVLGDSSWNPYAYSAVAYADHTLGYVYVLGWGTPDSASATEQTTWTNWTESLPDANVAATIIRHANYDYYSDAVVYSDADHDIADSLFYDSKPSWFGSLTWPPIDPFTPTVDDIPAKWRWDQYTTVGSPFYGDLDVLFTDDIGETTGFDNTFTAVMAVSESETARLYVEYPHRRVVTGTSATYAIWVEAYNSFTADVTLDATGLPTNATDSYSTNPIAYTGSSVATIATTGVAAGTYSITFTGTAEGGEVGSVRVILEVVASDNCAPKVPVRKIRVKQGDNAVFTVIADPTSGYTGDMDLSASGVPTGASGEFAAEQIAYNESTTYTVDSGTAAVGEHEITITGEGPV